MRDKALSLPALAAAIGLLGAGAGLGVPALWRSTGSRPAAVAPAASGRPGADVSRSPVPILGAPRLTSFTLPVARLTGSRTATVAPLHGLLQAAMIVVAPSSLPSGTLAAIRRLSGVTGAQSVEAAKIQVNGKYTAVLGVDPSTFRGYAAQKTAASDQFWQSVADGGMTVSYTMGRLDKLPFGGTVHVNGAKRENLAVGGFGTVGIEGVDAVVSHTVARSLGMPAANAIVISAPHANLASLATAVKTGHPARCRRGTAHDASHRRGHHDRGHRRRGARRLDIQRGGRPDQDRRHAQGRAQPAGHAVHLGRGGPGLVRLLRPGAMVVRAGQDDHAAGGRGPGPDRPGRARRPASAR